MNKHSKELYHKRILIFTKKVKLFFSKVKESTI